MIKKELIFLDLEVTDRESALDVIIERADALGLINDKKKYRKAVEDREKTMPTSVGFQVAIPHGKSDGVKQPFVAFLRANKKISWDIRSENLVNLIFLIKYRSPVPEIYIYNFYLKSVKS